MKLVELNDIITALKKNHQTINGLKTYLKSANYTLLGSGIYSSVYGNSSSVVIKIGENGHLDGFVEFIQYVQKNKGDENLPKIGTPRWFTEGKNEYFVVPMEKLSPVIEEYEAIITVLARVDMSKSIQTIYDHIRYFSEDIVSEKTVDNFLNYEFLPSLIKTIEKLQDVGNSLDLHSDNYMMRGNRIVITDPWG